MVSFSPINVAVRSVRPDRVSLTRDSQGLCADKAIGIFIEGRIIQPGEPGEPRDGLGLLAPRSGVLAVPAYISGMHYSGGFARAFLGRHRARIQCGKPNH